MLNSAGSLGFSAEAAARDRCQLEFLAQLMRQGANRYILKGGMAMRALYGSARLTKDIDFDCEDSVSTQSMKTQMPKALGLAARSAGLTKVSIKQTKDGGRACKWRVDGQIDGERPVTFEVEISRRGIPDEAYVTTKTLQPPPDYSIPPFIVRVYTDAAMAAGKVNALMSDNRNVPRDVYDLYDLARMKANPSPIWIAHVHREALERKKEALWAKVGGITFEQAYDELLPYLPPGVRDTIDRKRWQDLAAEVAGHVESWLDAAIPRAKTAKEMDRDPESDADLVGR